MKVACISDIHGLWGEHKLSPFRHRKSLINPWTIKNYPEADVLVFAGDILRNYDDARGSVNEVATQLNELELLNDFLGELKAHGIYRKIILVAGNHDWVFQRANDLARKRITNATYLENEHVYITTSDLKAVKFWGSPYQPWFWNWAFNFPDHNRDFARARAHSQACWDLIPNNTDVLITHGPPHGILDSTHDGSAVGCPWLKERLRTLKIKLHVFGHIHFSYGAKQLGDTKFVNASACGEDYRPTNAIQVVDIEV